MFDDFPGSRISSQTVRFEGAVDLEKIPRDPSTAGTMFLYLARFSDQRIKIGITTTLKQRLGSLRNTARLAGLSFVQLAWIQAGGDEAGLVERGILTRWKHLRIPGTEWLKGACFRTVLEDTEDYMTARRRAGWV